jgi:mono/diheme cytochrome c family protein
MVKKLAVFIILSCIILYSNSCTKDAYYPDVCFKSEILPIFLTNCTTAGCHNGKDKTKGIDLTNYEGIVSKIYPKMPSLSEVYEKISSGEMPPSGYPALSEKQINLVKAWIKMGAPNSTDCGISCDSSVHSFSKGVKPILDLHCVGCHGDKVSKGGFNFSTYEGVTTVKTSRLLSAIKHETGTLPMPEGAPALSECQINTIQNWVNSGIPND